MDPIIRAADVTSVRRLVRAGTWPAAPAPAIAPASMDQPVPPSPVARHAAPSTDEWNALEVRANAVAKAEDTLRQRLAELDEHERALCQRQAALEARERAMEEDLDMRRAAAELRGQAEGAQKLQAQIGAMQQEAQMLAAAQGTQLNTVLAALLESRASILAGADELLIEVVHGALCRLLGDSAAGLAMVAATVAEVLRGVRDSEPVRVYVHPQDLELLQGLTSADGNARVQLLADACVGLGGCLVETARGTLDARLDLQLRQLREALLAVRKARASLSVAD